MGFRKKMYTGAAAIALTAGLGMLMTATSAQAGIAQVNAPQGCIDNFTPGQNRTSFVTDSVDPNPGGGNRYSFTVCNTSDAFANDGGSGSGQGFLAIRDWEIPFFGDSLDGAGNLAQITNITAPEGWSFALEEIGISNPLTGWDGVAEFQQAGDPFREFFDELYDAQGRVNPFNSPDDGGVITHVLHWFTNECGFGNENVASFAVISESTCTNRFEEEVIDTDFFDPIGPAFAFSNDGGELEIDMDFRDGFGFDSPFDSGAAPYQASWVDFIVNTGDPQIPSLGSGGSPSAPGINLLNVNEVPEPGMLALFGTGLAGLFWSRNRRRRRTEDA